MRYFSVFLIFSVCFFACKNTETNSSEKGNSSVLHLTIPVGEVQKVKMSDIISEFKAIKLEFTDQSMIGDIQKIIVHNGLIYVLDIFGAKSIMVFDSDGKFVRKIGSLGKGPGQYLLPKDFIIDPYHNEIVIIDSRKINFYSLSGKFQRECEIGFTSVNFVQFGDNYLFAVGGRENYLFCKTNNSFKVVEKYLPVPPKSVIGDAARPFIKMDDLHFLFRPLIGDTIYFVSQEKVAPSRIVEFGKYKINNKEYLSLPPMEKAKLLLCQNNVNQCILHRYFENDAYIHINYNMSSKYYQYIYNKKTHNEVHFDKESLTDDITWEKESWNLLIGADDEYFYYLIQPYKYPSTKQLRQFLESFTKDEAQIQEMLHETSNPIFLMAKYKI